MIARSIGVVVLACAFLAPTSAAAPSPSVPSLSQPAISPNGREIAFVSGGNIWTVPSGGGDARLLVADGSTNARPMYSPDGTKLAFISMGTGGGDIDVLTMATGMIRRITYDDRYDELDGWSHDGEWLYFTSSSHNIYGADGIYRVRWTGGTPMPVINQQYMNTFFAAPSFDGTAIAFNARGFAGSQWWRKGHSHLDESEIWIRRGLQGPGRYERLEPDTSKNEWPMWGTGGALYFMSDRSGAQNLWERPARGTDRQLTHFTNGRVVWPSAELDGRTIVFERHFGVWRYNAATGTTTQVAIHLRGALLGPEQKLVSLTRTFTRYALSPDGKKIAFVAHGEVFAADAHRGGTAFHVPTPGYATTVTWSPDSNSVAFAAGYGHEELLYTYDFLNAERQQITKTAHDIHHPVYAPAGTQLRIAFEQDAREVRVADIATKRIRTLAHIDLPWTPGVPDRPLAWSPDGRWIAFFAAERGGFTNVHVVRVHRPAQQPLSFLANVYTNTMSWDPAGKYLLFDTTQRTEPAQVARVDVVPRTPRFQEQQFRALFTPSGQEPSQRQTIPSTAQQTNAAQGHAKPSHVPVVRIDLRGIRERLQFIPTGLDVGWERISPDGKMLLLSATGAGQTNLYLLPLRAQSSTTPPVAHQLTHTTGDKSFARWSPHGKRIFYLDRDDGTIHVVTAATGKDESPHFIADVEEDWNRDKVQAFTQAWSAMRDFYANPKLNGVNWNAVYREYLPRIRGAQNPDDFRRILSLMIGELNSSHSGVYPPHPGKETTGHLGLQFDRRVYETSGKLRVTEVIPQSPAATSGEIHVGDDIVAVDGTNLGPATNVDALLDNRIGREVVLRVSSSGRLHDVAVKPVNFATAMTLRYRLWVARNRAYVLRASGGRLGYVDMPDMSSESLANLYKDLDVTDFDKQGVVVDIRSNEGGFVNAYALDVFARRPYLRMFPRNMPSVAARVELGQRALEKPTVLIVNEETLSDGEDFTQGYEQLHLGKVVGVPTAGWIIYTSAIRLIDGSRVRLPFETVRTLQGQNMERHPRPVDVYVQQPVGSRTDPMLAAAVRVLLKRAALSRGPGKLSHWTNL